MGGWQDPWVPDLVPWDVWQPVPSETVREQSEVSPPRIFLSLGLGHMRWW